MTFQAAKAVSEPHDLVPTLSQQSVTNSSTVVVTSTASILTTSVAGSLPSSVMPKVKPIQKQQKLSTTVTTATATTSTVMVSIHSPVVTSQSQVTSTRQQSKNSYLNTNTHSVSSSNSPLNSSEEFFLTKNVTPAIPATSMVAPKLPMTVAPKLPVTAHVLHDSSMQQHTDVAKQLMQVIHQEKENQQSSERQLLTLSMPMSPTANSVEQHSSWPELLSQDEHRTTPTNMQEQQNVALPPFSSADLSSAPVSKSPYATQALPTANTVTHMPSTAVKVAKAPPSFFTTTRAPPTTGQATPTTKAAQATMAAIRTSTGITTPAIQATPTNKTASMTTGSQVASKNKALSLSPIGTQATPTSKPFSTSAARSLATPTTSRALPTQCHTLSVPTSAVKMSGFIGTPLAPHTSIATGAPPTVTAPPHVGNPTALTVEMPLVQMPKPPLQLFRDGENRYFFEQYGRMVSVHCT